MKVYIQMLRCAGSLRRALEDDGWRLEAAQGGGVRARHPHLHDEAEARSRLQPAGVAHVQCVPD